MKKLLISLATGLCLLFASAGFAADLATLKSEGVVGERADGYLGIVNPTSRKDVQDLVDEVNAKRRARYERIATTNDISLNEVETLAGKKALEKTAPGGWVFVTGWERK
jgi:uncharacterized protein YdbL (DUF1318 family)